tara:strand:+ start:245 stop:571 length:327 start_codon:yes stop_codon:yes gene_type:complete
MISRSDLPQLNATVLIKNNIRYEYLKVTPSSIKPIQSDRLPFDDNRYIERYTKIIRDTYNPLIVDKDFNLIDGHHRYDIIRRMEPEMTSVRVLQVEMTYQKLLEFFKK